METVAGWRVVIVERVVGQGTKREPSFHRAQRANFAFSASELPQTFALSTAHDFIWSPATNYNGRTNCPHEKNWRGGAGINSKTIEFAGFLSGDYQSLLTSAATKNRNGWHGRIYQLTVFLNFSLLLRRSHCFCTVWGPSTALTSMPANTRSSTFSDCQTTETKKN